MYNGPYINNTGLVFGYDTGIGTSTNNVATRLYPGDPTTNAIPNASTFGGGWASYDNGNDGTFITEFGTTGYQMLNRVSWNGIYQNFNLGSSGNYTFSAWFKYLGGTASNNGATVYISNYGGGDTAVALNKSLVGVWQRVSHTVNVTSPGNVYFYIISYGGGGSDRSTWQVTMPQAELGTILTPFVNGTRSATQALIDAKRATTIDLSTISFNSSAQPTFDGTDDFISISPFNPSSFTGLTLSVVANISSASGGWVRFFDIGSGADNNNLLFCRYSTTSNLFFGVYNGSGNAQFTFGGTIPFNQMAFYTATADGTNFRIYINGQLVHTAANSTIPIVTNRANGYIGRSNWADPYYNGTIPVATIYNRALSANEVAQNFQAYRSRFGI
jgi:hypothetical protein